ncbi:hypothetical protein G9U51_13910 [Calidifontibacter sp. DB0510]|uniref:SAV-6107-like HEPN domain-containing protein n=1 Tax=Metallococcus carri TaxID=1656884 RepID=A0A967EHR4_9MICO|nr:SAV_6107 family HEPN domain-containing protein [Metallococcus carri]NHN56868.1 hypothetical protein [Metallococcus carri]NOP37613.1 hypothetical protein [Calidifontibacter sp. DB2511S]
MSRSPHSAAAPPAALDLVERARGCLLEACHTPDLCERYRLAHIGALRAAAAVLAARSTPSPRSRPRSVWQVLPKVAPELTEWADFFADTARRRSAFERGATEPSAREADDLIRQTETFLGLVLAALGLPMREPLGRWVAPPTLVAPARRSGRI